MEILAKFLCCCVPLVLIASVSAQQDSTSVQVQILKPSVIQQRLESVQRKTADRRTTLEAFFRDAGCADVMEQRVSGSKEPNVICTADGQTQDVILVGGHFDADSHGSGAVDDWSGVSLLPSLYQSLHIKSRRHRFIFVGFSAEEQGLLGSINYVKRLSKVDRALVRAMVNLECLGLTPPKVWTHRADKGLLDAYVRVANALNVPLAGVNVDAVGDDDSHPFMAAKIPVITVHSVTQETLSILHSNRDQMQAINLDDYYMAYRLIATYLGYLDSKLQ